jgi:hypothetical protein
MFGKGRVPELTSLRKYEVSGSFSRHPLSLYKYEYADHIDLVPLPLSLIVPIMQAHSHRDCESWKYG